MSKKLIIIGGGIAGLTAGIYAQLNGFSSRLYEQHTVPGGLCTGWDRQGFHIDGCIHWLTGSREDTPLGKVWREIHALDPDIPLYQPESFAVVEHEGVTVSLYSDLTRMRRHLIETSPEDRVEINHFCDAIAAMAEPRIPLRAPDLMNPFEILRTGWATRESQRIMKKYHEALSSYVQRFQHPAIRQALLTIIPEQYQTYALIFTLGTVCSQNGGRPAGGSRAMALRMADYYQSLGGELVLGQAVDHILIENGKAVGVALWPDSESVETEAVYADYVVPATDVHVTLSTLLEGRFPAANIAQRDNDPRIYPTPSSVYAAYAVDDPLTDVPPDLFFSSAPYTFESEQYEHLSLKHYAYEPSFAPAGKNVLIAYLPADYYWWSDLAEDEKAYKAEKVRLALDLQQAIVHRFPHLAGKITSLDVATPLTYERYCSAWRGSWMSYGPTPQAERMFLRGRLKRVKNLYMAGQWLMPPGGLPVAILTGRWAIQRICQVEKQPWRCSN